MNPMGIRLKTSFNIWLKTRPNLVIGLAIFLVCLLVYLINRQTISSNDNIPHSLLAFNLLENHTLNFDAFRNSHFYGADGQCANCPGGVPYYFSEAPNGHLTSSYPIGTAVVAFPLYLVFFTYLKIQFFFQGLFSGNAITFPDITSVGFDAYRKFYEKLAGAIATSLSVVIFYFASRLKFSLKAAAVSTFVFAFATATWVINSQGLKQHGISNLLLITIVYCLLKANRVEGKPRQRLLLVAGICCGLIPSVRLPCSVFSLAAIAYSLFAFRKDTLFLFFGLPTALINIAWNYYFFGAGNLVGGGYSRLMDGGSGSYIFTLQHFTEAFWGLLSSPSDGLFTFSPVLVFSLFGTYQIWRMRAGKDEQLLACLIGASAILFINYCFFAPWNGGSGSFGSRYMTDLLPILCFPIGYFLERLTRQSDLSAAGLNAAGLNAAGEQHAQVQRPAFKAAAVLFLVALVFSTGVQAIGAFSRTTWGTVPLPLSGDGKARTWSWHDTQIQRHTNSIVFDFLNPVGNGNEYLSNTQGEIQQILDRGDARSAQASQRPLTMLAVPPGRQMVLQAQLKNTGTTRWYGYETGMVRGETRVLVRFFNAANQEVKPSTRNRLYVSGMPKPGETATAIGAIAFPKQRGDYTLKFELTVAGVGSFIDSPDFQIPLTVAGQPQKKKKKL